LKSLLAGVLAAALSLEGALADELRVGCSQAFAEAMNRIVPSFERSTGHHVSVWYGTTGAVVSKVRDGDPAALAILTTSALERLVALGKLRYDYMPVARGLVGIAARPGVRPDISSPAGLKAMLLASTSVAYPDPSSGGASGIAFERALNLLGIAEPMKSKSVLVANGASAGEMAARGEVQLAVQMISELKPVSGIEIIGALPGELQSPIVFSAGFGLIDESTEAARTFVTYLHSSEARDALRAAGLEPIAE
jgi:molybdate transport system substrate-binding protein